MHSIFFHASIFSLYVPLKLKDSILLDLVFFFHLTTLCLLNGEFSLLHSK